MTYVPHRQVRFNLYLFHYHFSIYLYSSSQHLFQIPFVVIIQIQNLVDFNQTTRCTQREQNAQLLVTSLSSDIKYCTEDNKIKPNM